MIKRYLVFLSAACVLVMNSFPDQLLAIPTSPNTPDKVPQRSALAAEFEVMNFKAVIDDRQPTIVENPAALQIDTPLVKINATVRCSLPLGTKFTVGFIQQVDSQDERFDYTIAYTSFELPSLPMSDSNGSDFPWMGNSHERATLSGGSADQDVELSTDDHPGSNVGWHEPLPPDGITEGPAVELQHVKRNQNFTTWLVVKDGNTGRITVLKKVSWKTLVDISVNPNHPLGSRATVNFIPVEQPTVVTPSSASKLLLTIPKNCLVAPSSNLSEQLWWTPKIAGIRLRTRFQ